MSSWASSSVRRMLFEAAGVDDVDAAVAAGDEAAEED